MRDDSDIPSAAARTADAGAATHLPGLAAPAPSDMLVTIRTAIADYHDSQGLKELAERTRRGEMDTSPVMVAARLATERVLKGLFE